MDDESSDENDDWLAGAEIGVSAHVSLFEGQCIELDPSRLPDPPEEPGVA